MSEPEDPKPEEAADDVTVGAWLDDGETAESQPAGADAIPEPTGQQPGLWARLMRTLRGGA